MLSRLQPNVGDERNLAVSLRPSVDARIRADEATGLRPAWLDSLLGEYRRNILATPRGALLRAEQLLAGHGRYELLLLEQGDEGPHDLRVEQLGRRTRLRSAAEGEAVALHFLHQHFLADIDAAFEHGTPMSRRGNLRGSSEVAIYDSLVLPFGRSLAQVVGYRAAIALGGDVVLTLRQEMVALRIVEGLSAKEIARELKMSPRTVEVHIAELKRRTGARNISHLAAQLVVRLLATGSH